MNRHEQRKAATHERIFRAAVELFLKNGYDATTIDEIAARADVARASFFLHFPSKAAILAHLGERQLELLRPLLLQAAQGEGTAPEKILQVFFTLAGGAEANRPLVRLAVTRIMADPELADYQRKNTAILNEILTGLVRAGQKEGSLRQEVNPDTAGEMLTGLYYFTMGAWLGTDVTVSFAGMLQERLDLVLKGLAAVGQLLE